MGLSLHLITVDHPAAIGIGAGGIAALHRTFALLASTAHDLEAAVATGITWTITQLRHHFHASAIRRQLPVGRQRHLAGAVGAMDGAGPEVGAMELIGRLVLREIRTQALLQQLAKLRDQSLVLLQHTPAELCRPLVGGLLNQHSDGVDVVGQGLATQPQRLERNRPTPSGGVKDGGLINAELLGLLQQPELFLLARAVLEGAVVAIGVVDSDPRAPGLVHRSLRRDRVPMDPKHVHERAPIGIGRQQ